MFKHCTGSDEMNRSRSLMVHSDGTRKSEDAQTHPKAVFTVTTQHVVTVNCNISFPPPFSWLLQRHENSWRYSRQLQK